MAASTQIPPLELRRDGPPDAAWTLVLAHGAGGAMDAPFMTGLAERVAAAGIEVVRFEFPYMRVRRATGRRRAPNTPRVLLETWREVITALGNPSRLVIGGKSMGGRVASAVADAAGVGGLVVLGYPFEPPGGRSGQDATGRTRGGVTVSDRLGGRPSGLLFEPITTPPNGTPR